jgi:hypothetical protein
LEEAAQAEIEANGYFTEPDWKEVISPDGVRCWVTRWRAATPPVSSPAAAAVAPLCASIPNDLEIPQFLRRSGSEGATS